MADAEALFKEASFKWERMLENGQFDYLGRDEFELLSQLRQWWCQSNLACGGARGWVAPLDEETRPFQIPQDQRGDHLTDVDAVRSLRAMLRLRRMRTLPKFAAFLASVYGPFNTERSLYSRASFKKNSAVALNEWRGLCAE